MNFKKHKRGEFYKDFYLKKLINKFNKTGHQYKIYKIFKKVWLKIKIKYKIHFTKFYKFLCEEWTHDFYVTKHKRSKSNYIYLPRFMKREKKLIVGIRWLVRLINEDKNNNLEKKFTNIFFELLSKNNNITTQREEINNIILENRTSFHLLKYL